MNEQVYIFPCKVFMRKYYLRIDFTTTCTIFSFGPSATYISAQEMEMDRNGRKTPQPFSTSTFEYENESKSGKARYENEHKLTEYRKFRKQSNSSGVMSNTVGIPKINTKY